MSYFCVIIIVLGLAVDQIRNSEKRIFAHESIFQTNWSFLDWGELARPYYIWTSAISVQHKPDYCAAYYLFYTQYLKVIYIAYILRLRNKQLWFDLNCG